MIFRKTALQGGACLADGTRIDFDSNGFYETEIESVIAQLSPIYEEVSDKPEAPKQVQASQQAVKAGMASSASLTAITK
jgi:hypothetical protein